MTDREYRVLCAELREECSDHNTIDTLIADVRKRDPRLADLILVAEAAEAAIAAYLKERDDN